jgi:hypothetical protein
MKIVEFPGGKDDDLMPMQKLREQLDKSELEHLDGRYVLLFDTGDSMAMLANVGDPGDVLLLMEKSKMAIMASVFDPDMDD